MTTSKYFAPNAVTVLCKRYFAKGTDFDTCSWCGERHETEDQFFDRVSMGNSEYREMLSNLLFLPNSPTLFNMGRSGTMSACFKFDVEDTMFDSPDGIMPVAMKAAKVLKAGGGVGYTLSALRPEGAVVNSTHGSALGSLGAMRIYHTLAKEITQGGKRDAAQMAILDCRHPDLEKFIHAKDINPDALGTFNISVSLTDEFMQKATTIEDSYEARILREMAESAWKTGDPGCYFYDTAEAGNPTPWAGHLTGTNPCGEVPLLRNEPCNLGSINLGKMLRMAFGVPIVDWDLLKRTIELAIRYLDDVLDRNTFPDPEIDAAARYTRKLGLGVCGFADMLTLMRIPYDSQEAVDLGGEIMGWINSHARSESLRLGKEKGVAPCFESDGRPQYRNATRTCIAPTGTIAILMNASSGIEPYFSLENTRTMGDGTTFVERPWTLNWLEERDPEFKPQVANEIAPVWHVAHQAAFQKHTDLAVSKTINMANSVTPDDILEAYIKMWKSGCKGGTVYRDGSRNNQVLKVIDTVSLIKPVNGISWRDALPDRRPGAITQKFEVGGMEGYLHVGLYDDGQPAEMFLDVARQGSTVSGLTDWASQIFSVGLQIAHKHGVPFSVFTDKWIGRKFEPMGLTIDPNIRTAESLADYLGQWFRHEFAKAGSPPVHTLAKGIGEACPECGSLMEPVEGCYLCRACGYSRC